MRPSDIDAVIPVERASFTTPWPASAFQYDLLHNRYAHYFVVLPRSSEEERPPRPWWRGHFQEEGPGMVLGYAGFWALIDEAHLANIAVAPAWRGRGLGELLLVTVIDRAVELGMQVVTLEVRQSNQIAQRLYRKYGFEVAGVRKHYYSDNSEDALIMTTGLITSAEYQRALAILKEKLLGRLRAGPAERRENGGETEK